MAKGTSMEEWPHVRGRDYIAWGSERDPDTFSKLLRAALKEENSRVWEIAIVALSWQRLAQFDEALLALDYWPFSPAKTFALVELRTGTNFKSIERTFDEWIMPECDPILTLAAMRYSVDCSHRAEEVIEALTRLQKAKVFKNWESLPDSSPMSCMKIKDAEQVKKYYKKYRRHLRDHLPLSTIEWGLDHR